jgi:hypothetical protein
MTIVATDACFAVRARKVKPDDFLRATC